MKVSETIRLQRQARHKIHEYLKAAATMAHELGWDKDRFQTVAAFAFYLRSDTFGEVATIKAGRELIEIAKELRNPVEGPTEVMPADITETRFLCPDCHAENAQWYDSLDQEALVKLPSKLCLRHERERSKSDT